MSALDRRSIFSDIASRLSAPTAFIGGASAGLRRYGLWTIEAALVGAIAYSASNIAITAMTPATIGSSEQTTALSGSAAPSTIGSTAQQIFFKSLDGAAAPLAEANAKIKLFGTRPGGNGRGSAIVSVNGGTQLSVSSGDRLKNGSKVTGIFADRIEIIANGEAGAIYLLPAKQRSQRKLVSKISTTELNGLSRLIDLQLTNKAARIGAAADSAILAGLGLVIGDEISLINGQSPTDASALENAFSRLMKGQSVTVEIRRSGAKIVKIIDAADMQTIIGSL